LGSTIQAVTHHPTPVTTKVLTIMKYQFTAGWTRYSGSMRRAASSVIPARSGSTVPIRRFAEYPAETPAKAAASPAKGCRPRAWKITAARGIRTT
jgi:hypothetical protein